MKVVTDNHMAIIHVQIGKNIVKNVLLNGRFNINIITKQLRLKLGLPKPKPTPYNLRTVDHTITKLVGLIHNVKTNIHDIPYVIMFIVVQNSVINTSYSMLLERPWLRDARIAHDWR
jgi:hypothetical protein